MKYTTLGQTDIKISKICLGTMTFGEQNSESEAHEQLDFALDQGVNFIDTAELYAVPNDPKTQGLTEQYIGTWIKARNNREKVVIGTKIVGPSPNLTYIRNPLDFSPASIEDALNTSLSRLQTDYVDLYQLHWPERKMNMFGQRGYIHVESDPWTDNFLESIQYLDSLIKIGKIRSWGLSNESAWGAMRCIQLCEKHQLTRPVSIQNPYNLLNRLYEIGLAEVSMREKAGLLAYSPLAFGWLTGKYHRNEQTPQSRLNLFKSKMTRYNSQQCYQATEAYLNISTKYNLSLTQMALSYINSRPFTSSNIIGATNLTKLKENIESIHIELPAECIKDIEAIQDQIPNPAP